MYINFILNVTLKYIFLNIFNTLYFRLKYRYKFKILKYDLKKYIILHLIHRILQKIKLFRQVMMAKFFSLKKLIICYMFERKVNYFPRIIYNFLKNFGLMQDNSNFNLTLFDKKIKFIFT